ncbi:MAG TPA: RsmE family RNA methyltransferase, partial [Usitatibacter sp.]|nr:RsmE family RNA methyltransferase [Usitatibacter sp.]
MPIPRIHCDLRLGPGAQFSLEPDAAQHVAKSLRLKAGDAIVVFDGRGGEYEASIQRIDRDRVDVKLGAFRDAGRESALALGLVQGLPEADKMDWIIQKATELGAGWIQPVTCDRSVVRLSGDRAARREAHWRRVAIAAAEHCGRTRVPEVR